MNSALIGTFWNNKKDAIKDAQEKTKARKFKFVVLEYGKGFMVVGKSQVKAIEKFLGRERLKN